MDTGLILELLVAVLILVIALLYSTVGHAGASGYLAAMALLGMAPNTEAAAASATFSDGATTWCRASRARLACSMLAG